MSEERGHVAVLRRGRGRLLSSKGGKRKGQLIYQVSTKKGKKKKP